MKPIPNYFQPRIKICYTFGIQSLSFNFSWKGRNFMLMAGIKITLIYLTIRTTQPSLSTQPDYKDEPHRTTFNGRKLKSNHLNYIFNISKLHLKETQNPGFLPSQQILRFFFFCLFVFFLGVFFFIFEATKQSKHNWRLPVVNSLLFLVLSFRLPNWFLWFGWHISGSLSVFVLFPARNHKHRIRNAY